MQNITVYDVVYNNVEIGTREIEGTLTKKEVIAIIEGEHNEVIQINARTVDVDEFLELRLEAMYESIEMIVVMEERDRCHPGW